MAKRSRRDRKNLRKRADRADERGLPSGPRPSSKAKKSDGVATVQSPRGSRVESGKSSALRIVGGALLLLALAWGLSQWRRSAAPPTDSALPVGSALP